MGSEMCIRDRKYFVLYLHLKDADQLGVENYEQYYEEEDDINVYKEQVCQITIVCITLF